jgi:hypothetical protein
MSTSEQQAEAAKTARSGVGRVRRKRSTRRALALAPNYPEYNMAPLMELIREADRLGYKVTR